MIEKNKEAQTQSLGELQQDLKSLKTLLLSRTPSTSAPAPPVPSFPPRLPAWQLSSPSSSPPNDTHATSVPTPVPFLANGKGKEVMESAIEAEG
jgi:peroxin-14